MDEETLHFIHSRKTGALIAASCVVGALLAGGNDEDVACLLRYGERVGIAFQIVDDLLNETSTLEALGKSVGSDRARQKATFPALFGIEASRRAAQEAIAGAIDAVEPFGNADFLRELAQFTLDRAR